MGSSQISNAGLQLMAIAFLLFVTGAAAMFWLLEGSEVVNSFTYGGNALMQYPPTVLPQISSACTCWRSATEALRK